MRFMPPTKATRPSIMASFLCNRRNLLRRNVFHQVSGRKTATSTPSCRIVSPRLPKKPAEPNPSCTTRTATPRSTARFIAAAIRRPVSSSASMYVSRRTSLNAASMAASSAGKNSAPHCSSVTRFPGGYTFIAAQAPPRVAHDPTSEPIRGHGARPRFPR